jgi:hypothetical protein
LVVIHRHAGHAAWLASRAREEDVEPVEIVPRIKRRDLLGGLIPEYYPVAT